MHAALWTMQRTRREEKGREEKRRGSNYTANAHDWQRRCRLFEGLRNARSLARRRRDRLSTSFSRGPLAVGSVSGASSFDVPTLLTCPGHALVPTPLHSSPLFSPLHFPKGDASPDRALPACLFAHHRCRSPTLFVAATPGPAHDRLLSSAANRERPSPMLASVQSSARGRTAAMERTH
jgi:hypothetical protein